MSTRHSAFGAAIALLLISGVLYQLLAGDTEQLDAAAARVAKVPMVVGDWHGTDEAADEASFAQTGAKGYWVRQYVNEKTRESVLVILMCGRAGKMAVHTPEVCYGGAGYEMHGQPAERAFQKDDRFWSAQFAKKSGQLRLYWAWNAHGSWEAPATPRWQFRGEPFLYKLYVSHEISGQAAQDDAIAEFLRAFVPVAKPVLFDR